jgi:hypothetical protein
MIPLGRGAAERYLFFMRTFLYTASFILIVGLAGCASYPARGLAAGVLASSESVAVVDAGRYLAFVPADRAAAAAKTGFVFYPGAYVGAEAYAPWLRALAEAGRYAAVVREPAGVALLGVDRAAELARAFPSVRRWAVGGHSLGGVAAAEYAAKSAAGGAPVAGLALLASYPAGSNDLSASEIPTLSLSADGDGLATPAKIAAATRLLPAATRYVLIAGGNHAGFGSYGPQKGDGPTSLPAGAQNARVAREIEAFLEALDAARN